MNIEDVRNYCLAKNAVTESFPFGEETLVFKVMDKMFALANLEGEFSINLKCDPEKARELREQYDSVKPGYHMNKQYWNTIYLNDSISDQLIKNWIDHSYAEVVKKLTRAQRALLEA